MLSILNFQIGEFADSSPSTFDYISLLISSTISVLSIWGGFMIARRIYSNEKADKESEELNIQNSEVNLFKNSISQLNIAIGNQLEKMDEYIRLRNFEFNFNQSVQVDFLQFTNIKYLYLKIGFANEEKIKKLNTLLSRLYALNDFRPSLRSEFRSYISKYNSHESKFYSYRILLYTKFFELCNQRSVNEKLEAGKKKITFSTEDIFMIQYANLRYGIFKDPQVISGNGMIDRDKLNERFILPLIELASKFIPEDYNAIEISDIANEVNSAKIDIDTLTTAHIDTIKAYVKILETVKAEIEDYLEIPPQENTKQQ
jgi:hypothetical protein